MVGGKKIWMVTDRSLCGSESETLRKPSAALVLGGQSARGDARLLKMPKHREMQAAGVGWGFGEKAVFQNPFFGFWNPVYYFACSRRRRLAGVLNIQ